MQVLKFKSDKVDTFLGSLFLVTAWASVLLLAALLLFLLLESWPLWSRVGVLSFISGQVWRPLSAVPQIGIAPMLVSTLWVAAGALVLAAPLGLACAAFLAEFAPAPLTAVMRSVLNLLTGIPSVVYGFLGAAVLVRFFEVSFDLPSGESLFAASLVLAIMVLPFIVANSEIALRSVLNDYRHTSLALGVSRPYYVMRILIPAARKGIIASMVLAFGRAAGETMAVLMMAGNTMFMPGSWFNQGEPLPALIALELGSASPGSLHYQALFAAGLVLLVLVILVNILLSSFLLPKGNEVKPF